MKRSSQVKPKVSGPSEKTIQVGPQIKKTYNLFPEDQFFNIEDWRWLKEPETVNEMIKENNISADNMVVFSNPVNSDMLLVEIKFSNAWM